MKTRHGCAQSDAALSTRTLPCWVEPACVFSHLRRLPGSALFESQPGSVGRYSVICVEPFGTMRTCAGRTVVAVAGNIRESNETPFGLLRELLAAWAVPYAPGSVFPGCAAGYLGYELRTFVEDSPISAPDDTGLPDCWIGFYNCTAVFDHLSRTISLEGGSSLGVPDPRPGLAMLEELIAQTHGENWAGRCSETADIGRVSASSSFTKEAYLAAVTCAKEYIAAGDVYQVNLSQRYTVPLRMDPWEIYLRLRERNPAPYAAYINPGGHQIISSSPESFLISDPVTRMVETRPIKGTRPRSADPTEDERLALELAASEKDRAENIMIVDLERNDLGRVCEFGSVGVPSLLAVESHPTVHHLVSTVAGRLREGLGAVDLVEACFPGGSITGAPKVRAMEIIDELEPVRRGVYTGSIGCIGFDGRVNLNIAIRTAVAKDGLCRFHVGGGIVADSDPEAEYQETLDKGRAFFEVLGCL